MKVVNKTRWQTAHLRAILSRVAKDELTPEQRKRLKVTVEYHRARPSSREEGGWCSGHCYLGQMRPFIGVTRHGKFDPVDFAHTLAHELMHAKGYNHREFSGVPRYNRVGAWRDRYAWATQLPMELKPVKATKPTPDVRIKHTQALIKRWETKAKRADTALRKLRIRLRNLERAAQVKVNLEKVQLIVRPNHVDFGNETMADGAYQP